MPFYIKKSALSTCSLFTSFAQVPRSICLPVSAGGAGGAGGGGAGGEVKKNEGEVVEQFEKADAEEEAEEERGVEWESFTSCQETLVGRREIKSQTLRPKVFTWLIWRCELKCQTSGKNGQSLQKTMMGPTDPLN